MLSDPLQPCKSSPCLNNGTCTDDILTQEFTCTCTAAYYGDLCEIPKFCSHPGLPKTDVNITLVSEGNSQYFYQPKTMMWFVGRAMNWTEAV